MASQRAVNMTNANGDRLVADFIASGGFTVATAEDPVSRASDAALHSGLDEVWARINAVTDRSEGPRVVRLLRLKRLIEDELQRRTHRDAS